MKTFAIQLTVVMMMIATSAFSQNLTDSKVTASISLEGQDRVEVRMMIPDDEIAVLKLFEKKKKNVYTKRISKSKNLLLSHLITAFPNGVYTYEIRNGKEVVSSADIVKSSGEDLRYKPVEGYAEAR